MTLYISYINKASFNPNSVGACPIHTVIILTTNRKIWVFVRRYLSPALHNHRFNTISLLTCLHARPLIRSTTGFVLIVQKISMKMDWSIETNVWYGVVYELYGKNGTDVYVCMVQMHFICHKTSIIASWPNVLLMSFLQLSNSHQRFIMSHRTSLSFRNHSNHTT